MVKIKAPASVVVDDDGFGQPEIGGDVGVRHGTFDYTDTTAKTLFTLPAGATPIDWLIDVTTDFDAGTNNNLDLGIDTDDDYFAADMAIGTQGVFRNGDTNYVPGRMGVKLTVDTPVQAIYKPSGTAATQGEARVLMYYMMTP
jgi:hypothetical protein